MAPLVTSLPFRMTDTPDPAAPGLPRDDPSKKKMNSPLSVGAAGGGAVVCDDGACAGGGGFTVAGTAAAVRAGAELWPLGLNFLQAGDPIIDWYCLVGVLWRWGGVACGGAGVA